MSAKRRVRVGSVSLSRQLFMLHTHPALLHEQLGTGGNDKNFSNSSKLLLARKQPFYIVTPMTAARQ